MAIDKVISSLRDAVALANDQHAEQKAIWAQEPAVLMIAANEDKTVILGLQDQNRRHEERAASARAHQERGIEPLVEQVSTLTAVNLRLEQGITNNRDYACEAQELASIIQKGLVVERPEHLTAKAPIDGMERERMTPDGSYSAFNDALAAKCCECAKPQNPPSITSAPPEEATPACAFDHGATEPLLSESARTHFRSSSHVFQTAGGRTQSITIHVNIDS